MGRILNFENFLTEKLLDKELRNRTILYHSTTFSAMINILSENKLYGSEMYDYGVATSRNRNYLFHIDDDCVPKTGLGECQLMLCRDKLRSRYSVIPFDWEEYKRTGEPDYVQSEEKIMTSCVHNVKRYIVGIHLNKNVTENCRKLMEHESDFILSSRIPIFDEKWNVIHLM
jgi:hypothetical protein